MADRNGYIGRAPGDSSVIVARKVYEPTGVQTDFTFNSGYTPGYCDVYLNGVRLIDEKDFTASNGSTVGLTSAAQNGDVVELVVYKAYNLGVPLADVTGNLDVTGNISASSSITAGTLFGDGSNISNIAGVAITQYIDANSLTVIGSPGVSTITRLGATDLNVTGIITANGLVGNVTGAAITVTGQATFSSDVSIGGTLTYEDVTNVDSVGMITARSGIAVTGGQLTVGVAYSVGNAGVATAAGFVGPLTGAVTGDLTGAVSGTTGSFSSNLTVGSGITFGSAGVATFSGTGDVHLLDNVKLIVGDGSDFTISHNGSNTMLEDSGTGNVVLRTNYFDVTNAGGSEDIAKFESDGPVSLYHNAIKTFTTVGTGISIYGPEGGNGQVLISADEGDDNADKFNLLVNTTGSFFLQNYASGSWANNLRAYGGGSVELMYGDGTKKFETTNDGTVTTGVSTATGLSALGSAIYGIESRANSTQSTNTNKALRVRNNSDTDTFNVSYKGAVGVGTDSPNFSSFGSNTSGIEISDVDTHNGLLVQSGTNEFYFANDSSTNYIWGEASAAIEVATDSTTRLKLTSGGDIDIYGQSSGITSVTWDASANSLIFKDYSEAKFGDGGDLRLYHDSGNSHIKNQTGTLRIRGDSVKINNAAANKNAIVCESDAVSLYYDNSAKLTTVHEGIMVSGMCSVTTGIAVTGGMLEGVRLVAGKLSDNTNIDLADANIWYFSTQESTTSTPNLRWDSSTSLAAKVIRGEAITVTIITTAAAGGYSAQLNIDGAGQTEEWNGGSAPSAGGDGGYDVYTHTIYRKVDGNWLVLSNVSNFA